MQKKLKTLLATGKTGQVIKELLEITQDNNDLHDEVVMLSGRFESYSKSKRMGTISYDEGNITLAKINAALLPVIDRCTMTNDVNENEEVQKIVARKAEPRAPLKNSRTEKNTRSKLWKWIVAAGILLAIPASISQFTGYNIQDFLGCNVKDADGEHTAVDSIGQEKRNGGVEERIKVKPVEELAIYVPKKEKGTVAKQDKKSEKTNNEIPRQDSTKIYLEKEDPDSFSIEDMHWMKENVRQDTGQGICYRGKDNNCEKYGRLYTWGEAQKVCPKGCRLPTSSDWVKLGDKPEKIEVYFRQNSLGGRKSNGTFAFGGKVGFFWTSTESSDHDKIAYGYRVKGNDVAKEDYDKSSYLSCRCVKDKK